GPRPDRDRSRGGARLPRHLAAGLAGVDRGERGRENPPRDDKPRLRRLLAGRRPPDRPPSLPAHLLPLRPCRICSGPPHRRAAGFPRAGIFRVDWARVLLLVLRLLGVYFATAAAAIFLANRYVSPIRMGVRLLLAFGPFLLVGKALLTAGIHAPVDI